MSPPNKKIHLKIFLNVRTFLYPFTFTSLGRRKYGPRGETFIIIGVFPTFLNTNKFPSFLKNWGCILKSQHKLSDKKTLQLHNEVHVLTNMLSPPATTHCLLLGSKLYFSPLATLQGNLNVIEDE